ncbi:MAG: hypothetical protein ACRDFX_13700, partial [Chloroflexota bacterium]
MRRLHQLLWSGPIFALALGVSLNVSGASSLAASKPMHSGHPMGPVSFMHDHQVGGAITAMLMPAHARTCGHKVTGGGSVKMIPVHVGKMSGPHIDLVVRLHGAGAMRKFGISGMITGKAPIKWSGMAGTSETHMGGGLYVKMRLMPMLRAGRYTARIMLHDTACGGMMGHPLAYRTPKT